jgi:hypothetical protein
MKPTELIPTEESEVGTDYGLQINEKLTSAPYRRRKGEEFLQSKELELNLRNTLLPLNYTYFPDML